MIETLILLVGACWPCRTESLCLVLVDLRNARIATRRRDSELLLGQRSSCLSSLSEALDALCAVVKTMRSLEASASSAGRTF